MRTLLLITAILTTIACNADVLNQESKDKSGSAQLSESVLFKSYTFEVKDIKIDITNVNDEKIISSKGLKLRIDTINGTGFAKSESKIKLNSLANSDIIKISENDIDKFIGYEISSEIRKCDEKGGFNVRINYKSFSPDINSLGVGVNISEIRSEFTVFLNMPLEMGGLTTQIPVNDKERITLKRKIIITLKECDDK